MNINLSKHATTLDMVSGEQPRADTEELTGKGDSQTEETAVVKGRKSYTLEKKQSMIAKCDQNGGDVAKTARDWIITSHTDAYSKGVLC